MLVKVWQPDGAQAKPIPPSPRASFLPSVFESKSEQSASVLSGSRQVLIPRTGVSKNKHSGEYTRMIYLKGYPCVKHVIIHIQRVCMDYGDF